jgi:two-component system cell cycle response regulator
MSSVNRTARIRRGTAQGAAPTEASYRAVGRAGKQGTRLRRASEISLTNAGLDLSMRLRAFQRALRSRVERRDALLEMVRLVNTTLDPERLAGLILDRAATWVPAPCWALVSSDLSGQLSILGDRGLIPEMDPAIYGVANWVIHHGEEFAAGDLRTDARVTDALVGTVLAFPLSSRGRRIGSLIGLDRAPSTREPRLAPTMLRAVRSLLEPAATALDNALLLKRAEALSVTDDLTRLYNSRYLDLVLRRETKRAKRSGRPLSLLFLDLDDFKSVNDAHGHLCGSRALVEAAAVIRGSARETDVVARFGGDEFALVLPDTGTAGAVAVGERVRQRIANHRFLAAEGLEIHLTVSVGVASLPDVAASPDELVRAADTAMYQVKQRGKNGIQSATTPADN